MNRGSYICGQCLKEVSIVTRLRPVYDKRGRVISRVCGDCARKFATAIKIKRKPKYKWEHNDSRPDETR